jgi:hypothetical protein
MVTAKEVVLPAQRDGTSQSKGQNNCPHDPSLAKVTKRRTFARLPSLFILKPLVFRKLFCTFAPVITILMRIIMSERDKQIEKERKGVVELLLKKNGLTRRQLVDDLVGMWAASWVHILTEEEKKQFPHLVF